MAYNQKDQAGRAPMMKTGRDIPAQFYGPQMAQDGIIDDIRSAVKKVGQTISTAHKAGMKKYKQNFSTASSWDGSRGGTSRNYNPVNYITGAASSLLNSK